MNYANVLLFLVFSTASIHGMEDDKKFANPLDKESKKTSTQPIPIPSGNLLYPKKDQKSRMVHIEISPSSNLWMLGLRSSNSPEKRSSETSLR